MITLILQMKAVLLNVILSSLKSEHLSLKSKEKLNRINHAFNCFALFTVSDVKWWKNVIKPLLRSVYRYKGHIDLRSGTEVWTLPDKYSNRISLLIACDFE